MPTFIKWQSLVALVALIATGICGFVVIRYVIRYGDLHAWREVPARVERWSLIESRQRGTLFTKVLSLRCAYEYAWEGRTHRGRAISAGGLTDEQKRSWHALLTAHKHSGNPIPCYVDPNNPSQAVRSRSSTLADFKAHIATMILATAYLIVYFVRWPPWRFQADEVE